MLRKPGSDGMGAKRAKLDGEGPHIRWDEETLAEHDKERGTRQKIEEAPTPYRYEDEDDDGDSSGVATPNDSAIGLMGGSAAAAGEIGEDDVDSGGMVASSPPARPGDNVMDVWESLRAKLHYEQQQQVQRDAATSAQAVAQVHTQRVPPMVMDAETVGFDREPAPATDAFKAKRNKHYNEFELVKAMRARMDDDDDEEEEDIDDDEQVAGKMEAETVGFDREPAPATDAFKAKRNKHYNEFELVKAMRARMDDDDDDDDD